MPAPRAPAASQRPAPRKRSPLARIALVLALALAGTALVVGGYYVFELRPRMKRLEDPYWGVKPSRKRTIDARESAGSGFDQMLPLPGGPYGLTWNGTSFLTCKRDDPWGLMRIERDRDGDWTTQLVPVIEPGYAQRISLDGLAWNGRDYVGLAMGSWFQERHDTLFVVLDGTTLRPVRTLPAPDHLGAIAFDGEGYWAATRNNTTSSGETPRLYRLDADLEVVATHEPPSVGCQGLAWDGRYLWYVDVFSDSITVLDVSGGTPEVVHSWASPLEYLSGIAWDGTSIWVADYGENAIRRLAEPTRASWLGGRTPPAEGQVSQIPAGDADVAELRRQLRSGHWSERTRAGFALRERGLAIDYDRRQETSPAPPSPSKIDLDDFVLEVRGDRLVASWDAWIGEDYIPRAGESTSGIVSIPLFARYSVTVRSDALPAPVEKEYEARPGANVERDVVLVDGLRPGRYSASFFIHVQYVDAKEGAKILNLNEASLEVETK